MQRSELPCTVLFCTVLCVLRRFAVFSVCITHETVRALLQSSALGVLAAVWPNRWPYASKLPFQRCKILHSPSLCLSLLFVHLEQKEGKTGSDSKYFMASAQYVVQWPWKDCWSASNVRWIDLIETKVGCSLNNIFLFWLWCICLIYAVELHLFEIMLWAVVWVVSFVNPGRI